MKLETFAPHIRTRNRAQRTNTQDIVMARYRKIRAEAGVSLMEAMTALFLTGLVVAAVFGAYINQHKNMMIQDGIINMQQNARAAIDELARFIRMAGHFVPLGVDPITSVNANPDTIEITFAIDDRTATLQYDMVSESGPLRCDGEELSFLNGYSIGYIFDPDSGGGEFFRIGEVQDSPKQIALNTYMLTKRYRKGSQIMALQRIKYYVDNSDTTHPNLMMQILGEDPVVYAEYVDDLQFKFRMKNGMVVDVPPIPVETREVMMTVVARTAMCDPDFEGNPYRRTSYASKVNLRNLDVW